MAKTKPKCKEIVKKKKKTRSAAQLANPGGRPRLFSTIEDLNSLNSTVDSYFEYLDKRGRHYTLTGLALELGIDRTTLVNYVNRGMAEDATELERKFFHTIKRAKSKCEAYAESRLMDSGQATGTIFLLKNNHGWNDEKTVNHNGKVVYQEVDFDL